MASSAYADAINQGQFIPIESQTNNNSFGSELVRLCFNVRVKNLPISLNPSYKVEYITNNGLGNVPKTDYKKLMTSAPIDLGCTYSLISGLFTYEGVIYSDTSNNADNNIKLKPVDLRLKLSYQLPEYNVTKYIGFEIKADNLHIDKFVPYPGQRYNQFRMNNGFFGDVNMDHPGGISFEVLPNIEYDYQYYDPDDKSLMEASKANHDSGEKHHADYGGIGHAIFTAFPTLPVGYQGMYEDGWMPGVLTINIGLNIDMNNEAFHIYTENPSSKAYQIKDLMGQYFNNNLDKYHVVQNIDNIVDFSGKLNTTNFNVMGFSEINWIQYLRTRGVNTFVSMERAMAITKHAIGIDSLTMSPYGLRYRICSYVYHGSDMDHGSGLNEAPYSENRLVYGTHYHIYELMEDVRSAQKVCDGTMGGTTTLYKYK